MWKAICYLVWNNAQAIAEDSSRKMYATHDKDYTLHMNTPAHQFIIPHPTTGQPKQTLVYTENFTVKNYRSIWFKNSKTPCLYFKIPSRTALERLIDFLQEFVGISIYIITCIRNWAMVKSKNIHKISNIHVVKTKLNRHGIQIFRKSQRDNKTQIYAHQLCFAKKISLKKN